MGIPALEFGLWTGVLAAHGGSAKPPEKAALEFALWMGVLGAVVVIAAYVIWYLRRGLVSPEDDMEDTDETPLYTTAEVERLKAEGLIDAAQYEKLKAEAFAASKRRADRAKKRRNKKRGLFG